MDNKFLRNASTVCDKHPTVAATLFSFQRLCYQRWWGDDHVPWIRTEWRGGGVGPIWIYYSDINLQGKNYTVVLNTNIISILTYSVWNKCKGLKHSHAQTCNAQTYHCLKVQFILPYHCLKVQCITQVQDYLNNLNNINRNQQCSMNLHECPV
jgi:hypothetical protein